MLTLRSVLFFPLAPFSPFAPPAFLAFASSLLLLLLGSSPPLPLPLLWEQHASSDSLSPERFINGDSSGQSDSSIRSLRSMPNEMRFGVSNMKMWSGDSMCDSDADYGYGIRITIRIHEQSTEYWILFLMGLFYLIGLVFWFWFLVGFGFGNGGESRKCQIRCVSYSIGYNPI